MPISVVFKNICMQFFAMYQLHAPSRRKVVKACQNLGHSIEKVGAASESGRS